MSDPWRTFVVLSYGIFAAAFCVSALISLKYPDFMFDISFSNKKRHYSTVFYVIGGLINAYACFHPLTGNSTNYMIAGYLYCVAFVWFVIRLIKQERSKGREQGEGEAE